MLIKRPEDIKTSEITPESIYLKRRKFMSSGATLVAGLAAGCVENADSQPIELSDALPPEPQYQALEYTPANTQSPQGFYTDEKQTPYEDILAYNNFYEFGTGKGDPAKYADSLTVAPWQVEVIGNCAKPGTYNLEDIIGRQSLEERVYRLRCVEAWSMVVPWVGFSLASMLKQFEPDGNAKFVQFDTLVRPKEMRGQRSLSSIIDWPYQEGLRIDEAMHPLSFIATGIYGKEIPRQNGAPLRLVMPWKYGFKSIKSIVRIRFTEKQPATSWSQLAPREYGFYANVNPEVDHPRWSQAKERRLPSTLLSPNRIDTQMFNGYAEQVAGLYTNMDLKRLY